MKANALKVSQPRSQRIPWGIYNLCEDGLSLGSCFDISGKAYIHVADGGNHCIQVFKSGGKFLKKMRLKAIVTESWDGHPASSLTMTMYCTWQKMAIINYQCSPQKVNFWHWLAQRELAEEMESSTVLVEWLCMKMKSCFCLIATTTVYSSTDQLQYTIMYVYPRFTKIIQVRMYPKLV